ncbi:2-thiouracil desulfurase family protein [Clostridium botulinum]
MKVLVSSCVMGCNCKYNGGNNLSSRVVDFLRDKEVIEICPEMLASMSIPRASAEIVDGCVTESNGKNVDKEYRKGVELALEKIKGEDIDLVILQSRSPTCGVNRIYDGSFTGKLIEGQGLFAQALIYAGYKVIDSEDV